MFVHCAKACRWPFCIHSDDGAQQCQCYRSLQIATYTAKKARRWLLTILFAFASELQWCLPIFNATIVGIAAHHVHNVGC